MKNITDFQEFLATITNVDDSIEHFDLRKYKISCEELSDLNKVIPLYPNLKTIDFTDCAIDYEKITIIRDVVKSSKSLIGISFDENTICENTISSIYEIFCANTNLRKLSLNQCGIKDRGVEELAKIQNLEELHLISNQIGYDGIRILFGKSSLTKLNLAYNSIKDADLENFPTNNLVKLSLSYNKISDEGAMIIAEKLKTNTGLKELSLSCNRIGRKGIEALSSIASLTINLSCNDSPERSPSPDPTPQKLSTQSPIHQL
jgi:Ran GTPase-activating protein (RanGAP) involved in mRNA processing and transport